MTKRPESWTDWLRRELAWSNTPESWRERLGILVLILAAAALVGWSQSFSLPQLVLLWGGLLAALAILGRRGWLRLFGPVLFYDLITTSRRGRYFLIRLIYVSMLAIVLFWMYTVWYIGREYRGHGTVKDTAQLAEIFFFTFSSLQFLVIGLLTPAYTAGAIADEKDRKTLEFLLATDLRNREIVLSKLATRMLNLTMLILGGLPILSFTQFFGGVDPNLLLVSFATLGLTMLSLGGLSMLCSVFMKKPRDAIVLTYLITVAYLAISATSLLLLFWPAVSGLPLWIGSSPIVVSDVINWLNAGNLPVAIVRMMIAWNQGRGLADILPTLLRDYAAFHLLVAVGCTVWAVFRLRAVALKQSYGKVQKQPLFVRWFGRPRVGMYPMIWKEIFADPGIRFGWLGRSVIVLLILGSFIPAAFIISEYFRQRFLGGGPVFWNPWEEMSRYMNVWVRVLGTGAACLTLVAVAVRASGAISGERDRQTFDGLLTTPMTSDAILFAKWLGSILSVRLAWLWIGSIWLLAVITGGLHPLAVPLLPAAWLVYAMVFAGIGTLYSMASRTTLRSTMWTLLTVLAVSVGHWLLSSMCCFMPLSLLANMRNYTVEFLAKAEFGQTPPLVLGFLALHGDEFDNRYNRKDSFEMLATSVFGLFCWGLAAGVLWLTASARFKVLTHRLPFRRKSTTVRGRLNRNLSETGPAHPAQLTASAEESSGPS